MLDICKFACRGDIYERQGFGISPDASHVQGTGYYASVTGPDLVWGSGCMLKITNPGPTTGGFPDSHHVREQIDISCYGPDQFGCPREKFTLINVSPLGSEPILITGPRKSV